MDQGNPWRYIMAKKLLGGETGPQPGLTPDEQIDLLFPETPEEAALRKIRESHIPAKRKRPPTLDELFMQKAMRDKYRTTG